MKKNLSSVSILTPSGAEAGRIHFIPADLGLCQRLSESRSAFVETVSRLSTANINPDGSGADPASEVIILAAEQQFAELLNHVCGLESALEAFRKYKPFAVMKGRQFWALSVMDALNKAFDIVAANNKRIQKRMRRRG